MSHAGVQAAFKDFALLTENAPKSMAQFMADVLKSGATSEQVAEWLKAYWELHRCLQIEICPDWYNHVGLKED